MRTLLVICSCLMFFSALSQGISGNLHFEETVHDFGALSEDDAPPTHIFIFTNQGNLPVLIREVRSSCLCAAPGFSRQPVMPGQTGEIKITFKPKGHPGKFDKRIVVVTAERPAGLALRIKGRVLPGKPDAYPSYPHRIGNLRLKNTVCRFGLIYSGKRKEERIAVVNEGEYPLTFRFLHLPSYLACYSEPGTLKPGEEGDLVFVALPSQEQAPGKYSDHIRLDLTGSPSVSFPGFFIVVEMEIVKINK